MGKAAARASVMIAKAKAADRALGATAQSDIEARLRKLDAARENLADALAAMDDLRLNAEASKRELARLQLALDAAVAQKASTDAEIVAARSLAQMDASSVRRVLGLPTPTELWRGRILGFIMGVIASLAAAFVWELFLKAAIAA